MHKSVSFYTLGCKLNYAETSTIGRQLESHGFAKCDFTDGADLYVINTCSVTDNADKKCKKVVKEALKHNPNAFVVVVGCYAQLKPQEIANISGVDLVLGAAEKFNLITHLSDLVKKEKAAVFNNDIKDTKHFVAGYSFGDRTRSFLKVQDGCNYFCSFCTIPLARGFSRSDTIENTVLQAKKIAETGVKEIVLTGVNIGDFGKTHSEPFIDLLKELDQLQGIERFRISSIEPNLLTNEIIHFVSTSQKFVPHFHIPLQSGNNKILKLMRRRYQRELYAERVAYIKELMPHCAIGVDVIAGFPGESYDDFIETYEFLNALDISYLHAFPYSERPNTKAILLDGVVPQNERYERVNRLRILSEKKRQYFYRQHLQSERKALFEHEKHEGQMLGFTDNSIRVKMAYDPLLVNEVITVQLNEIDAENEVLAEIVPIFEAH